MIIEYIRYKIQKERRQEFESSYEKAGKSLKASSHCLQYELSHCLEEPDNYILNRLGFAGWPPQRLPNKSRISNIL